jgi:hypothetical protein
MDLVHGVPMFHFVLRILPGNLRFRRVLTNLVRSNVSSRFRTSSKKTAEIGPTPLFSGLGRRADLVVRLRR